MESLIGKEVVAFKFTGGPVFTHNMELRIGQIAKIIKHDKNYCVLLFSDGCSWSYPLPELLEHLVDKEPEELINIDDLFEQIKNI